MADGPVSNLPPGMDAYAGYVNLSGIGITYPMVVAKFPNARHLSITTNGSAAMCADVESGAMKEWTGYDYGYCAVSNVNALVTAYGRPRKLWTAHYDPALGAHICSPACWPGLVTTADGTQWTDHGNADWDESLLADDFFDTTEQPERRRDHDQHHHRGPAPRLRRDRLDRLALVARDRPAGLGLARRAASVVNLPGHVYAFALAAICFIGGIVLVAVNKQVPPELWQAGFLAAGAGAGIALPTTAPTQPTPTPTPVVPPQVVPVPPPAAPPAA